jgi:hypothetical protein
MTLAPDVLRNDQLLGGDGSPCLPVLAGTQRATYVTVFEVPPCVTCFAAARQASMVGKLPTCIGCPPILKISQTTGPIFFSIIPSLEVAPHTACARSRVWRYSRTPLRPSRPGWLPTRLLLGLYSVNDPKQCQRLRRIGKPSARAAPTPLLRRERVVRAAPPISHSSTRFRASSAEHLHRGRSRLGPRFPGRVLAIPWQAIEAVDPALRVPSTKKH